MLRFLVKKKKSLNIVKLTDYDGNKLHANVLNVFEFKLSMTTTGAQFSLSDFYCTKSELKLLRI